MKKILTICILLLIILIQSISHAQTLNESIFMFRTTEKIAPNMSEEMNEKDILGIKTCLMQCFMMAWMNDYKKINQIICHGYILEKGLKDELCKNVNHKTKMGYLKARNIILGY